MLTNNEIRDRIQIAALELLQVATLLIEAHSALLMHHFERARGIIIDLQEKLGTIELSIPKDEDL